MRELVALFTAFVLVGAALAAWAAYWFTGHGTVLFIALFLTLSCLVMAIRHGGNE